MRSSVNRLSELEKEQILQESYKPGCVIADLAKQHGIPSRVIYDLRCKKKLASEVAIAANSASDFVKLSVNMPPKKAVSLKRAVLEFDNLSISIDGNIKSSTLVQMLTILEESC